MDEITAALGKQGVTNYKRIIIKKGGEKIQTNAYIPTLNQPKIPKRVKISIALRGLNNISQHL